MSNFMKKSKKAIVTILIVMMVVTVSPIIALAAQESNVPVITPQQTAGQVRPGAELKFTITDDTKLGYIFYAWNRRIDGNKQTIITLEDEPKQYEFKTNAPTEPGLYEFSIAAQDYYGNITYWMNIPYIVVANPSGVVDTTKPVFIFNIPDEYPSNNSIIAQEMPITLRARDDSGIYYMAYKWTRDLNQADYATGCTTVYNQSVLQIKAPREPGVWYLQMYARDGANNISEGYYTKVTIQDMIAPTLTLNGPTEVDVPQNGTYTDPGATFSDNYDAQKVVYANETLDTSKVGPQILTYTATDAAGNEANTVSRTVTVVGKEKTYELTAPTKTEYYVNDPIDLTGASIKVTDERGNISYVTPTEDMFADFSTATPNTKQIFFTYNGTNIIYEYKVNDFISDILITPPTKLEYEYQEEFDIAGGQVQKVMASGVETIAERMTMDMLSGYHKEKLGQQIITVNYEGKQKTFKVTVKDSTKPVISINGANPQIIKKGEAYTELGATVTDNYDKDLNIIMDATQVNINTVGIYDVTYDAIDTSGNRADTVKRKVHIVDYTELQEKIESTTKLVASDYTSESWQNLQNIVAESNDKIVANQSIQTEIDEQVAKVENAIATLQAITVNQDALKEYIDLFVSTDYTNWAELEILINEAKNITDLQSEFDQKLEEIKAFTLVAKEIDSTKLDEIETQLASLEQTDYTETSWKAIQEKITQAKEQNLQSKFDEIVNTIDLTTLVKLPKISNIVVTTSNPNSAYAKVGDNVTIIFDTNVELDINQSIAKIEDKVVTLQKLTETQYQFNYTFTQEDVEGLISYTIEPKGILENVGAKVEENTSIQFDKTAPSIAFAEGISDVDVAINDIYEIKDSDVVVSDNNTSVEAISIKTNKETLKLNELGDYVISYTAVDEAGNESEAISRTIRVKDYVADIEITTPNKLNYIYQEELDLTGATVKMIMASGNEVEAEAMTMDMITGYDAEVIGEQTITVTYAGKTKEFNVNVDRAEYDMTGIRFENKTVTYNGTEQSVEITGTLPEGVTVEYEGNLGTNAGTYHATAKFVVADEANYNTIADMNADLIINPAEGTTKPGYEVPTVQSIVYHRDRTLADIALPTGWSWMDETIVPEVGTMTYKAKYTSDDSNYADVLEVEISITVLQPADQTQLNQYLEEIGYTDLVGTDYTNWNEFETLIDEAKSATVQDNLDILLDRIKAYTLQAKPVDQTELDRYEQKLEGIVGTDYTNWDELQTKIAEARAITDLQSKFDSKMQEVTSLRMNIKPVDQRTLRDLEVQLAMKNQEDYSAQSWKAVQDKIQEAKQQVLQSKFDEIIATIDLDRDLLPKELQSINVSVLPKVNYEFGEELEVTGGKIQLVYDNGSTEEMDMIASEVTGYKADQLGEQVLTVTHLGKTAIYRVNVVNAIQGIEITEPTKTEYRYGEELDLTGLVVKEVLKNNDKNTLNADQYSVSGYEAETLGEQTITVRYRDYTKTFIVTVTDYTQSIKVNKQPNKTTYKKGQAFDETGMVIEKVTASGKTEVIDLLDITTTGYQADVIGAQTITVTYTEGETTFETTFNVIVAEGTKPVIALNGEATLTVEVNTSYEELGATAYSADLEAEVPVQIGGDVVDVTRKGTYVITYTAEGADSVIRTVNVVDTTKPEITLSEENIYELTLNQGKPEYKATATDNYDGEVTVTITDTINMTIPGNYKVIFTAKDSENNTTVIEKTVTVKDSTKPVIAITGEDPQIVEVNTEYKATGVTVTDDSGETIPLTINKNNLNMNRLGTYTVIYSAKDSSGNETTVERTVKVVDTTKPVIHANRTEVSFINGKGTFDYENAVSVTDNYDTSIRATYTGNVNANKIGTYKVTYSAVDSSGNKAEDVVITIKVTDYAPIISYYNEDNLKVEMTDGQVFRKHLSIMHNKGTATIKEAKEANFKPYNGELLTDGIYTIKVVAEDGTSSQKTFIIDTLAPVVTGIKAGRYNVAQTIIFEDISDVGVATLTSNDGRFIDLKALGQSSYTVNESGTYTLRVEDKYGNAIMPIVFRITLP